MKTDKIKISSDGDGMELALAEVGRFADYIFLDKKEALRLRLLVEETFGMLKTIAIDFHGDFWIEGGENKLCYIRIVVQTMIYLEKKRQFQKLSTDREKTSSKGFMKKLGHFIERGIYGSEDDAKKQELVATLKNSKSGKLIGNANLVVNLNGDKTTYKSDSKGQIIFSTADLTSGTHVGTISYGGNAKYNSISAAFKVDV